MGPSKVFAKLNLKDQNEIVVLDSPDSFESELERLEGVGVRRRLPDTDSPSFVLAFVTCKAQVDAVGQRLAKMTGGDPIVWLAYPKGSSRRYACDFNRDTGWDALGAAGFEGVRQVAIDEDWTALRFRRAERIRKLTRDPSRVLSATGKKRTAKSK